MEIITKIIDWIADNPKTTTGILVFLWEYFSRKVKTKRDYSIINLTKRSADYFVKNKKEPLGIH